MWNMVENSHPQELISGSPSLASFHSAPARWYIFRATSMSRRVRKIGQVRVLGLKRAKSSFDIGKLRSGSAISSGRCRKNANRA